MIYEMFGIGETAAHRSPSDWSLDVHCSGVVCHLLLSLLIWPVTVQAYKRISGSVVTDLPEMILPTGLVLEYCFELTMERLCILCIFLMRIF